MATMTINSGELNALQPVSLGSSVVDNATACLASSVLYYIPIGQTFETTTVIWLNNNGTGVPPAGFYSDGTIVRQWDGVSSLGVVNYCSCQIWTAELDAQAPSLETIEFTVALCGDPTPVSYTLNPDESIEICGTLISIENLTGWTGPITDDNQGDYGRITTQNVSCNPNEGIEVNLRFGNQPSDACNDESYAPYYIANGDTFTGTDKLYTDPGLNTLAPSGYYRQQFNTTVRQWDNGAEAFVGTDFCSIVNSCKTWSLSTGLSTPSGEETSISGINCIGEAVNLTIAAGATTSFCGTVTSIQTLFGWTPGPITEDNDAGSGNRVWVSDEEC